MQSTGDAIPGPGTVSAPQHKDHMNERTAEESTKRVDGEFISGSQQQDTQQALESQAWRSDSSLADDDAGPDGIDHNKLFGGGEDDPFYDPEADEEDTQWMEEQRGGRGSDAILSCPSCFTTLCVECQQHEKYAGQFRAMFVRNCRVDDSQSKAAPSKGGRRSRKQARRGEAEPVEKLKPVFCDVCDTEVGVVDSEEVYHFFNVFPSNA